MNLLADFAWIGEKTNCLARVLKNKNYDFYTGCKYLNTEFEVGSAVTIKYNHKFQIGIIHYFYDIPYREHADKYRVAVELYYRPKDLKTNDNTTLHFDFELLKQDKPNLTFLPIINIKSRCSIVYGLEDEQPEDLLREFSDTTTDVIYICRFIAAPNRKNRYNLRGVIQNTIEISDDELDSDNPVNVAEIEVSSTSNKPEHKENQNDNIHIKIQGTFSGRNETSDGFQIDVSNDQQTESDHGTNNIFTISNVGDANNIKLKFTRTKNVSSVSVESSFTNKSQNDIKTTPNKPQLHSVNAQLSLTKNAAKVTKNDSNNGQDQIFSESSTSKQNESENSDKIINVQSSKAKKKTYILQSPKQTFKKISLSHLFTDNQPESDSSYELYEEIGLDDSSKIAPKLTKKLIKKSPPFHKKIRNRIEDSPESDCSSEAFDHIDAPANSSKTARKVVKIHQKKSQQFYTKIQNGTVNSRESVSSSEVYDDIDANSSKTAPKVVKIHQQKSPFYKKKQNSKVGLLESDSSSDNSCKIAPKVAKKYQKKSPPIYNEIQKRTDDFPESNSSDALDKNSSKLAKKIKNKTSDQTPNNARSSIENNKKVEASESSINLQKKDILKENYINDYEFKISESSSIVMRKQTKPLIEPSKSNPVVLVEKINLSLKTMDKIKHKRDFVRESLLNDISKERKRRKSTRVNNKSYIESKISLDSQVTDSSSDSEFSFAECSEDSLSEEFEDEQSELIETVEKDEIFESYSLRSRTTRVLRSKAQAKENISPHRVPIKTYSCTTKFKKTEESQRCVKSVSKINSSHCEDANKSKAEANSLIKKPNKQCRINSESVNDSVEDIEISNTDESVLTKSTPAKRHYRLRSESECNSAQHNEIAAKILCLSKYELRPKTPVKMDIENKSPKRSLSRVKFVEKSSKKNQMEEIEENVTSRRTSTRGKRIVSRDSSDEDFRTPKKQSRSVTPSLKGTPKSVRMLLKNMTPGIEERDEAVASCSTPMRRARIGLSAHSVPTSMPCREKEYMNIYNFITGKITDKSSGCMYISGVPGTGKTMTVFKVMQNITDNTNFQSVTFLKLNALALTEPRQIYVEIVKILLSKTLHWEAALNEIQRFFKSKKEKRPHILLIDELDKLCNRKQDVIYNLLDLPFHSKIPLVVITIANTMDLPERILTNKVNSRLGLTRLTFKPYQFKELVQIVTARLSNVKVFKPEALELVARKVAAVSGDARRALAMCTRATEIAEEETHDLVSMEIINRVMLEMISSSSSQAVKSCSKIEQFILTAISNEVLRTGNEEVPFVSMLENLKKLCYLEKVSVPGTGVCLKLCQHLSSFRLLITQHTRYDINMTLMLNISLDDIHYALR